MSGSSAKRRSAASRVFLGVAVLVVLLAVALTGAWFYLANELDTRVEAALEAAAGEGVSVGCANREVFGYPFRLGLACDAVTLDAPQNGLRATGGAVRTAAQIYDPTRIVAELGSPVSLDAPDIPPLDLLWDLAQASARFEGEGLAQVSLALDNPIMALRQPAADRLEVARSQRLELHARRNEGDLDLAIVDRGVIVTPPGVSALPPFDLTADMSVNGGGAWLRDGLPGGRLEEAVRGSAGAIRSLRLALPGGGAAEVSGPYSISDEGEISGDFALAVEDAQAIAGLVGTLVPSVQGIASSIASGLAFAGRQEDGRTVVDIQVREGRAQLGFIPLGRIPPI